MEIFCLNGYQNEKIQLELVEVLGFPYFWSFLPLFIHRLVALWHKKPTSRDLNLLVVFLLDFIKLIGYKTIHKRDGRLAQLEEHLVYTERVGSSNLSAPTNKTTAFTAVFLLVWALRFELPRKGVWLQAKGMREHAGRQSRWAQWMERSGIDSQRHQ